MTEPRKRPAESTITSSEDPMQQSPDGVGGEHRHDMSHPLPLALLGGVFVALLVLTFITVAVTWVDLGAMNVWMALLIAVVKAGLVGLYFMHLRYDSAFNSVILLSSLLFVAIFIAAAISDSREYYDNLQPPASVTPVSPGTP